MHFPSFFVANFRSHYYYLVRRWNHSLISSLQCTTTVTTLNLNCNCGLVCLIDALRRCDDGSAANGQLVFFSFFLSNPSHWMQVVRHTRCEPIDGNCSTITIFSFFCHKNFRGFSLNFHIFPDHMKCTGAVARTLFKSVHSFPLYILCSRNSHWLLVFFFFSS